MVPPSPPKQSRKSYNNSEPASKRVKCAKNNDTKMEESKEVFDVLKEKHDKHYKPEQLHAWAQLVQMKKHISLDEPPDYPYFKAKGRAAKTPQENKLETDVSNSSQSPKPAAISVISPGKKVHMRTECIEQLKKIGQLLENGNISQQQHNMLQEAIMKDIYKF